MCCSATSLGINYCLTSSGNSLMCVWSIEVIFHSTLRFEAAIQRWQISSSRPQRELIYFFRIVNLYLHILITYEGMFIGVLGQVAFIFYEDIVESFESKKTITAFCTLARFQIPLKKNCITIFVHTLGLRKKCSSFLCRQDYGESIKNNWDDFIENVS